MKIDLHPSAVKHFNEKVENLLSFIEQVPIKIETPNRSPSDLYIKRKITEEEIIGEMDNFSTDYKGNIIERFFNYNEKRYGLTSENYKRLKEVAEKLQELPNFRCMLSCSFIEEKIFFWIKYKFRKDNVPANFLDYLNLQANDIIKEATSWIPIANLEVQTNFPILKSEIRPISKNLIDYWVEKFVTPRAKNKEDAIELFNKFREDNQGLAAVVTSITAEPIYAFEHAKEEAAKVISILGLFSAAMLIPDVRCVQNIKGSEYVPQTTAFFEIEETKFRLIKSVLNKSDMNYRYLSVDEITSLRNVGIDKISLLMNVEKLGDFQEIILNFILLYSKAAFTDEPLEKVVYVLSSMESLLLKNENEPIQQNLAERIALFTTKVFEERKDIIKTVKLVYGLRSRYLHHGNKRLDMEIISNFLKYAWIFFTKLLDEMDIYKNKNEFINTIDDCKLK